MADDEPWRSDPLVCGSCIAWRHPDPVTRGEDGAPIGNCRLRPELARVPATLGRCAQYRGRGQPAALPRSRTRAAAPRAPRGAAPPPPPAPARPEHWSPEQVALHRAGRAALGGGLTRSMQGRFEGGKTEIVDAEGRVISHPNERFFAHLCRLADALDALEARVEDAEARGLVRRARGSLTTFNFLFHDAKDHFSGKE